MDDLNQVQEGIDSANLDGDINRSRSMTPNRISLQRVLKRLRMRQYITDKEKQVNLVEVDDNADLKKTLIEEKLQKAEMLRLEQEKNRQNFMKKNKQKKDLIHVKQAEKITKLKENINEKTERAQQRYEENLRTKILKAKNESSKADEIAFITMLENKTKKLTMDEKLKETQERKQQLLQKISEKQNMKRLQKEEQIEKKKLEFEKSQSIKLSQILNKTAAADNRRTRM